MDLSQKIRSIPDFPKEGILYRDITPLLHDSQSLHQSVRELTEIAKKWDFDYICAPESRGYIFAVPIALALGKGFIPARKPGKLPYQKVSQSFLLEYGEATIEIHQDAIKKGDKVLLLDDLLATGGTSRAMADLVHQLGGEVVGCLFLIELTDLTGREVLSDFDVQSIIHF